MLYALLMSLIFSMILSFYLTAIVDNQRNLRNQTSFLTAQLMAKMVMARISEKENGEITFNHGLVNYQQQQETIQITVRLKEDGVYRFNLPKNLK